MTTVFNLGGTIALAYDESGPVTLSGAELVGESDAMLVDLDPVQSNALSWIHLITVRDQLTSLAAAGTATAVIITGTDTVEDVAYFLHLAAPPFTRIALLCSLHTATRGRRAPGIDAALTWLRSGTDGGVRLFVDGVPYPVPFEKCWTGSGWDFAASPESLPRWRVPEHTDLDPVMPKVAVIPVGIGCGEWASAVIESVTPEGIVLEAYGSGDVPPELVPAVEAHLGRGGVVVIASLAPHGLVEPTYRGIAGTSHELLQAGCHGAGTLTARQARMRLALVLACSGGRALADQAFESFSA